MDTEDENGERQTYRGLAEERLHEMEGFKLGS